MKLDNDLRDLEGLVEQGEMKGKVEDVEKLSGLAQDIRDTMMDYQVRTWAVFARTMSKRVQRLRCSRTSTTRTTKSS